MIAFLIKTFERPHLLARLLDSIAQFYPEAHVYVADDGQRPADLTGCRVRVEHIRLPYDSGLSAGRNAMIDASTEPYLLLLDDDFVFTAATRIECFLAVLAARPEIGIVTGSTVVDRQRERYEGRFAIEDGGRRLRLIPLDSAESSVRPDDSGMWPVLDVDYGINFFLARRSVFDVVRWDPELKLSEHISFFLAAHRAGVRVAFAPEVLVDHVKERSSTQYRCYRERGPRYLGLFLQRAGLRELVTHHGKIVDRRWLMGAV